MPSYALPTPSGRRRGLGALLLAGIVLLAGCSASIDAAPRASPTSGTSASTVSTGPSTTEPSTIDQDPDAVLVTLRYQRATIAGVQSTTEGELHVDGVAAVTSLDAEGKTVDRSEHRLSSSELARARELIAAIGAGSEPSAAVSDVGRISLEIPVDGTIRSLSVDDWSAAGGTDGLSPWDKKFVDDVLELRDLVLHASTASPPSTMSTSTTPPPTTR